MKPKGINPIERSIEKILLVLVSVAFLGALAMQFLVQPNKVEINGGREVPLQDLYAELGNRAQQLEGRIQDTNPDLPDIAVSGIDERYAQARASDAAGVDQLPDALASSVDVLRDAPIAGIEGAQTAGPVTIPQVPAPAAPTALAHWGALDPFALRANPALADVAPVNQPHDVIAVSVEASYPAKAMSEALAASRDGLRAIPGSWRQSVEILDVELERQPMMPDGSWGPAEPALTAAASLDPANSFNAGSPSLSDLLGAAEYARQNREAVVQPLFPPTISGPRWLPPTEARQAATGRSDPNSPVRLALDLDRLNAQIADLQRRQENASGRRAESANRRIDELSNRAADIAERLRVVVKEQEDARKGELRQLARPLADLSNVRVWAHDLDPEPGKTYRYRSRVAINNPVFRKEAELATEDSTQLELANTPVIHSDWSPWSAPVQVEDRVTYRVTSATPPGRYGAGASATIELYALYYGHYRLRRLGFEPGETLDTEIDIPDWLVRFDVGSLTQDRLDDLLDEGVSVIGRPGSRPAVDSISPPSPVTLLDVRTLPIRESTTLGQDFSPTEVILRDKDGQVRVVRPQDGEEDTATARLRLSALQGETSPLRVAYRQNIQAPRATGQSSSQPGAPRQPASDKFGRDPRGGRGP